MPQDEQPLKIPEAVMATLKRRAYEHELAKWAEGHIHLMHEALASLEHLNKETGHDFSLRADMRKSLAALPEKP